RRGGREAVRLLHPGHPVGPVGELRVDAEHRLLRILLEEVRQVAQRVQVVLLGEGLGGGEPVGVVDLRVRQPDDPVLLQVGLSYRLVLLLFGRYGLVVAQMGQPPRARVLPHQVDLTFLQRVPGTVRTGDVGEVDGLGAGGLQGDLRDVGEQHLLGAVLAPLRDLHALQLRHLPDRPRLHIERQGGVDVESTCAHQQRQSGQQSTRTTHATPSGPPSAPLRAVPHDSPLGPRYLSSSAPSQSTNSATPTASTAPTTSTDVRFSLYPASINSPSPPPLTKNANVAVPTASTSDVRNPARIMGTASGSSMRNNTPNADIPMPRPASTSAGSTESIPVMVFRSTGSSE